jgi:hypothetical protein
MTPRNERHVVPGSRGGWDVKAPGADRASSHHDNQSEAIDRAREILHNDGGGELIVHNERARSATLTPLRPAKTRSRRETDADLGDGAVAPLSQDGVGLRRELQSRTPSRSRRHWTTR